MHPQNKMNQPVRAALLVCGCLSIVISSLLYVENHVGMLSWASRDRDLRVLEAPESIITANGKFNNATEQRTLRLKSRRRLQEYQEQQLPPQEGQLLPPQEGQEGELLPEGELQEGEEGEGEPEPVQLTEEEIQHKQMRSYLGGLYPPVDRDMMPLYLRDTHDEQTHQVLDMFHPSGQARPRNRDMVFYWHIPKASGSTLKNIMNFCFDLARAEKLTDPPTMEYARDKVLNMDVSSPDGLEISFANRIVDSNMVDVIVSNYFLSASALFTENHYGKTFTIMRHPVDIALSLFHYRRKAHWERSHRDDWNKLSFHEYVSMDGYMDSWMVRQLTGTMPWVELDESHLDRAKFMLERKIFVGIMSEMDETLRQLKDHFGWVEKEPFCVFNNLHDKPANSNPHGGLQGGRGGKTWNVLAEKEKWDLSLYHFALELFGKQRERYPPRPKEPIIEEVLEEQPMEQQPMEQILVV